MQYVFSRFGFIGEMWGVRRVHSGGLWSTRTRAESLRGNIGCLELIDVYLDRKYERRISRAIARHWHALICEFNSTSTDLESVEEAVSDTEEELIRWSQGQPLSKAACGYVLGRAYLEPATAFYPTGELDRVRFCVAEAVRHDPKCLGHRRLCLIPADRLPGPRGAGWLKRRAFAAYHNSTKMLSRKGRS